MTDSPDLKIHPKLKRKIWAVQAKWGLIILVPIFFLMLASWRRFNLAWLATAFVVVCAATWFVYKTDEPDFDKIRVVISAIVGIGLFATFVIKEFIQRKKLRSKINGDWT